MTALIRFALILAWVTLIFWGAVALIEEIRVRRLTRRIDEAVELTRPRRDWFDDDPWSQW